MDDAGAGHLAQFGDRDIAGPSTTLEPQNFNRKPEEWPLNSFRLCGNTRFIKLKIEDELDYIFKRIARKKEVGFFKTPHLTMGIEKETLVGGRSLKTEVHNGLIEIPEIYDVLRQVGRTSIFG